MGNTTSSISGSERSKGGYHKVWVFLHKTWTIMIAEKWPTKSRMSEKSDYQSQYSICSCSQCQQNEEDFSSGCYR